MDCTHENATPVNQTRHCLYHAQISSYGIMDLIWGRGAHCDPNGGRIKQDRGSIYNTNISQHADYDPQILGKPWATTQTIARQCQEQQCKNKELPLPASPTADNLDASLICVT